MKATPSCWLLAGLLACSWLPVSADPLKSTSLNREEGGVYLEDFLAEPLRLEVKKPANIYYTLRADRYLGTLRAGQEVTVLAIHDRAYRVRGLAQQGQVAGWVGPAFLESLEPELVENLKKAHARAIIVADLISHKEVALGMTLDEVQASLGKPTKKSSRVDKDGRTDTYEYITYEAVPEYNLTRDAAGRIYRTTTYVYIESGKVSIDFEDEIVTAISESEGGPGRGNVRVVPAPIVVF